MLTLSEFVKLFNGTSIDYDNFYGAQCVDLVQFWNRNLGSNDRFTGDASSLANQTLNGFYTWIPNTPGGVPQAGDIVVFDGSFNNSVGHVMIATGKGDTNTFEAFEQNDPGACLIKTYGYGNYTLGWLRPNKLPENFETESNVYRLDRDTNWNIINAMGTALGIPADSSNKSLTQEKFVSEIKRLQAPSALPQPDEDIPTLVTKLIKKLFHV